MRFPFYVDFGRAVFAVALAVLLYFVAVSETNPEGWNESKQYQVLVQPVNVPSGLVVLDRPPNVYVRVRAPLSVFSRLNQNSFTATIDCANAQAGENSLPIVVTPTDPEVRDAQADPGTVTLHLDAIREQALPVRVNVTGQPPSGYQQGQWSVDPPRLTVAGASTLVGRATEAVVDVSVDRVTVSVNGVFTPRIVDDRGNDLRDLNLRANPPSVTVQVPINQQTQYKQVGIRPNIQGQPAIGYVLQPAVVNPPTATLSGDPADLEGASVVETAPIDVSGIS